MYRPKRRFWSFRKSNRPSLAEDRSGATAVEFALVSIPFFMLLIGIFEVGLVHFANRMVDNAVVSASRLVRTGQAHETNLSADGFRAQVCNFMPAFMCDMDKIVVEIQSIEDFADATSVDSLYDADGKLREDTGYDIGGKSEIVVVNVIYKWPMLTSILSLDNADNGYERHLTSTMVFRNEPFNESED